MAEETQEQQGSGGDEDEVEQAKQEMKEFEERDELPSDLSEWPDGRAKYETFGGPEGEHGYDDGPEAKLGPSGVRHHEDGTVTVDGEEVDDPEELKGEPIPGGPTDPETSGGR